MQFASSSLKERKMLYSLQANDFSVGEDILRVLQNYQCNIIEHSDTKEIIDRTGEKVKAILSFD